jgi:arylsulfatase A
VKDLLPVQLYDLGIDPGERNNVELEHPDLVQRLSAKMEEIARNGRSTPGPNQPNTGEVNVWNKGQARRK